MIKIMFMLRAIKKLKKTKNFALRVRIRHEIDVLNYDLKPENLDKTFCKIFGITIKDGIIKY